MKVLRRREYFWPSVWTGVALFLSVVLAAEHFLGGVSMNAGARSPAKVADAKLLPPFSLAADSGQEPETVARPLFVPTRRPSPPALATAATAMRRGQFVLTGVTIAPGTSFAFLRESATGKTHSVKVGSQINGIAVDKVEPRQIVLRQGEETEILALNVQAPARTAAAPTPVTGVPGLGGVPVPGKAAQVPPPVAGASAPGGAPPAPVAAPAPQGAATQAPATPPASGRRRPWIKP